MNKYTRDVVLMLCIACAALSFEKCTGKSDGNTSDKNAVETVDNNKVENDAEEETNETTKIKISEGTAFYDGVAFIKTDGTGKCEEGRYAIDTEGNILYKLEDGIDEQILYFNGVASYDNKLVDKHGNILASPEKTGYTKLLTPYCEGYAIAAYFEEKYPESILKIGVLNGEGEWSVPLSEDNCFIKELEKYSKDHIFTKSIPNVIMDVETEWSINSETNSIALTNSYTNNDEMAYFAYYSKDTFKLADTPILYNVKNNKVSEDGTENYNCENLYGQYSYSQYEIENGKTECVENNEGYTFKIDSNDVGSKYYCVYDKDGNEMFKPKEMDDNETSCIYLDKDGFVLRLPSVFAAEGKYEYYDLQGNLKVKYKDIEKMQPFHDGIAYATDYINNHMYIDKSGNKVIE